MKSKLLMLCIFFISVIASSQDLAVVDSMKRALANAKTNEERFWILGPLSMTLMNTNIKEADQYGDQLSREAELTRNRSLIVKGLLINGQRYSFFTSNKNHLQRSLEYYNQALDLAKKNKLEKETAEALLSIASLYMSFPDLDKAMNYSTQAFSIISSQKDDSLKVAAYYSLGSIYQEKKERILALRNYLTALRIAEENKNPLLLRSCYYVLSQFYSGIQEFDKAIDYLKKAADQLPLTNLPNKSYTSVLDLFMTGDLYMQKKNFQMSAYYYDSSIKKADELKYPPLKMPGYRGLLRQYMQAKQPERALAYLNSRSDLKSFITNFGASHLIDNSYAAIYTQLGKYDSARYYYEKALPGFMSTTTGGQVSFYFQYADFFKKSGDPVKALEHFNKALTLANQTKDVEWQQRIAKELDSVYVSVGDFKQSRHFSNLFHFYKDSLQKLSEEKDLMQMELADEEQRQNRIAREEAEKLRERHNIQYMGITIAIAVLFLLLVLMGAFRVSEVTIRIMGFFAFILLFEFITLIADNKIHHLTHGEPLHVLAIKVVLIAMLLPLHHWLEHRVINYLASRKLIIPDRKSIWKSLTKRKTVNH
mgnify:CR=1 FL=1